MSHVYVYEPAQDDCRTIGICGALTPKECTFHEIANGESTLTIEHPYDEYQRYIFLQENYILKTAVPVRNAPEVKNGQYVSTVAKYTVLDGTTKDERTIYNKQEKGKKLKVVPVGSEITVLKILDNVDRYHVSYTETIVKKKKATTKTYTGWMTGSQTVLRYDSTVSVSQDSSGLESVTTSWTVKDQLFRIYSVEKSESGIKATARHISYDWMYDLVKPSADDYDRLASSIELKDAISIVLDSCIEEPDCTIDTVISGTRAGNNWSGKDPITCILDPENGMCKKWGGQLIRDNNNLYILYDCGLDRGVILQYGKNVTGITYTLDTSNVASAILPVGEDAKGKPVHLAKTYVQNDDLESFSEISGDSSGVIYTNDHESYPFERIYLLSCEDCKVAESGEPTLATVRSRMLVQGEQAVKDGCNVPDITVKADVKQIGDSIQYSQYKGLQSLFLYDYATVRYHRDGHNIIDIVVSVSEIDWDVLEDKMNELTLGSLVDMSSKVSSWQVASGGSGNTFGGTGVSYNDVVSISESTVLSALNNTDSDIYKKVVEIAQSVKGSEP